MIFYGQNMNYVSSFRISVYFFLRICWAFVKVPSYPHFDRLSAAGYEFILMLLLPFEIIRDLIRHVKVSSK